MTAPAPFPRSRALAAALVLSLALAACGGEDTSVDADAGATDDAAATSEASAEPAGTTESFPVTVEDDYGEVTIESRPERIVSLAPATTEILFAVGAGGQVVAADEFSTYPATAPTTDLSGYDPNVEAVVAYEPDLVVVSLDANDIVESLQALDITVLVNDAPVDADGGYGVITTLGRATGHADEAAGVVSGMQAALEDAYAAAPEDSGLRVYHELDDTFFAASSSSFIGSVYEQMGAVNIADDADPDRTGYPQLTEEAIVAADPELIVISDQAPYTAEDVAARPGWSEITAVRNGDIVTVDADVSSRWGPRLPQLVRLLAEAMGAAHAPSGR